MSLRTSYQPYFLATACAVVGLFTPILLNAQSAPGGSGGGGAYVCRPKNGKMTAELIELWEAQHVRHEDIAYSDAPVDTQIESALKRLKFIDPEFEAVVAKDLKEIDKSIFDVAEKEIGLAPPPDALSGYMKPGCPPEGMLYYDQDAKENEKLKRRKTVFNALLTNTDRAAARTHEAIYKANRDLHGDTDSVGTRKLNAFLYQKSTTFPKFTPPVGAKVFHCQNNDVDVYAMRTGEITEMGAQIGQWTLVWKRFHADPFGVPMYSVANASGMRFVSSIKTKLGTLTYFPACYSELNSAGITISEDSSRNPSLLISQDTNSPPTLFELACSPE
jgi:hypothetical protein